MSDPEQDGPVAETEDFEDLYENAPCGLLSVSPDGRILKSNATVARLLTYPAAALAGMRLSDLMSIGGRIYWETHLSPLLRMRGRVEAVALDLVTSEGRKVPAFASAIERRDDRGRAIVIQLALFEGADRRQYERTLVSTRQAVELANDVLQTNEKLIQESLRLERLNSELREQFIAVLGHDLRNPLTAISSGLELFGRETQSEKGSRLLSMMGGSVTRMSGLIDNMLDFARGRLGGGLGLMRDAQVLLEPVLLQVVQELRTSAPDRLMEVSIAIAGPVDCDRARIAQLVSNLLGNAIAHGSPAEPIRLTARTLGDVLEISVSNGGKPIPDEMMDRLFQPFFRGEVRENQQGLGLGLYIASEIAEAHGGSLTAISSETETRFTFRMPLTAGK